MYSQEQIKSVTEIIKKYFKDKLSSIILFGSYARDSSGENSDLDLAIILDENISRKERKNILNKLWWETSGIGVSVDLIVKSYTDYVIEKELPTISRTISREGKLIWQRT